MEHFHISSKQCWNPSLLIIAVSLKIIKIPITFFPLFNFSVSCFSHIYCTMLHTFLSMSQMCCCVSHGCFENIWFQLFQQYTEKRKLKKKRKRKDFSFLLIFFFHVEWLNFTLHWHIWGDAPWNQSNSGISEEEYFWKLQRYVVILLPPALDRLLYYVTAVILVACILGW